MRRPGTRPNFRASGPGSARRFYLEGVDDLAAGARSIGREVLGDEVIFEAGEGPATIVKTDDGRQAHAWIEPLPASGGA
jgi:hypothetical protein